jgi:hypothetical protein
MFPVPQNVEELRRLAESDVPVLAFAFKRRAASRLRELGNKTRILYTSGYTGDGAIPSIALEPDTFFIQKPFSLKALARKVGEALKAQENAAGSSPQLPDSSMSCKVAAGNG